MMVALHLIEDEADLARLDREWPVLLAASSADTPFLSWEWLSTWWRTLHRDRTLHVLELREGRDLIAVAPLALRPRRPRRLLPFRILEFIGTGNVGSDYLDLIVAQGSERRAIDAFADYLDQRRLAVALSRTREDGLAMRLLPSLGGAGNWHVKRGASEVCPYIRLESHSWDTYLSSLGSAHRYNVRRRLRNLERDFDLRLQTARSDVERSEFLEALIRLHTKRWYSQRERSTAFNRQALIRFHQEFTAAALRRGWLRLQLLCLNGAPAAALYGLKYRNTFYFYQSGFDPAFLRCSIGLANLALAIRSAIEEGVNEFDMLHGDESYKFLWTRDMHRLSRFTLLPPGGRGAVCRSVIEFREGLKDILRRNPSSETPGTGSQVVASEHRWSR